MSATIISIGTALPAVRLSQTQLADDVSRVQSKTEREKQIVSHLFNRAGVDFRSTSVYGTGSEKSAPFFQERTEEMPFGPDTEERMQRYQVEAERLAVQACRQALFEQAEIRPLVASIDQIVTVSCTGFAAPGFDLALIEQLNLERTVGRTHIGFMGCHGALNGMRAARAFVEANPNKHVLLCAAEVCSLHFQYGFDANSLVANSLFADGAAALLLSKENFDKQSDRWTIVANRSLVVENSSAAITWRIANHGFLMTLSAELPQLVEAHLPQFLSQFLAEEGLAIEEIQSWAIHPGGKKILDAAQRCLSLSEKQIAPSRAVLASCGNMSSATVLFILKELVAQRAPRPCVLLGFGPGMTIEAALLK
jgi:predicted naringenin-chalcone synthase